jgi:hypothetical protein
LTNSIYQGEGVITTLSLLRPQHFSPAISRRPVEWHHSSLTPPTDIFMQRSNVLLVEDDDDARVLYGYMLALAGYRVKALRNGLEAFAEMRINRASDRDRHRDAGDQQLGFDCGRQVK